MAKPHALPVWDRRFERRFEEYLDDHPSTYETRPTWSITAWLEAQPAYDWLLAAFQHSRRSAKNIQPFITKHKIDMSEFEPVQYRSYAEFFTRKFKQGIRRFPDVPHIMGAFAEARYLGWTHVAEGQKFPVKGHSLDAASILGSAERAKPFERGPVLLARLSPVDYHHVHFPDDGEILKDYRIGGRLWTINWKALLSKEDILFSNERHVNLLQTENFGLLGFVEIGAMSVGRVVQVHDVSVRFKRGAEKSYFDFGGSAVVVFGEAGRWRPADDVLANTLNGVETLLRLGEPTASAR